MNTVDFGHLLLLDTAAYTIIAVILLCLIVSSSLTLRLRRTYRAIHDDLALSLQRAEPPDAPLLLDLKREIDLAIEAGNLQLNAQTLVDTSVHRHMRAELRAERFIRAVPGLVIILGLVGTFYGLTLSIGKLSSLIAADAPDSIEITEAMIRGLTACLSGMAIAFVTSLVGISAGIVATLIGVFAGIAQERDGLLSRLESFVDERTARLQADPGGTSKVRSEDAVVQRLERSIAAFGEHILGLDNSVTRFDASLRQFSSTTRDFKEFNLHMKDNIQRMSLSFGDFSDFLLQRVDGRADAAGAPHKGKAQLAPGAGELAPRGGQ